jgi:hypothetical protein
MLFPVFLSRIYARLNIRHCLNYVLLLGLMLAFLCETVCFLSLHMKHLLRSCTRHSKTTSALSNRNFLELISQYLITPGRYLCSFLLHVSFHELLFYLLNCFFDSILFIKLLFAFSLTISLLSRWHIKLICFLTKTRIMWWQNIRICW